MLEMQLIPFLTLLLARPRVSLSYRVFTLRDPLCVHVYLRVFAYVCECVLGWCIEINWEGTANLLLVILLSLFLVQLTH